MMEEMKKMNKLSDKERKQLQTIQEGLSGVKPIDDTWITYTVKVLKSNPALFKTLFKGRGAAIGERYG